MWGPKLLYLRKPSRSLSYCLEITAPHPRFGRTGVQRDFGRHESVSHFMFHFVQTYMFLSCSWHYEGHKLVVQWTHLDAIIMYNINWTKVNKLCQAQASSTHMYLTQNMYRGMIRTLWLGRFLKIATISFIFMSPPTPQNSYIET